MRVLNKYYVSKKRVGIKDKYFDILYNKKINTTSYIDIYNTVYDICKKAFDAQNAVK